MQKMMRCIACVGFFITHYVFSLATHYIEKHIINKSSSHTIFHPHTLIVWVHGTRFIEGREFKTIFQKISHIKKAYMLITVRYYRKIVNAFSSYKSFSKEHLYFFGWSGKLCNKERKRCALNLYNDLITLKKDYEEKHNISPTIILIGHSHGGNVILHMASYHSPKSHFFIDKIVLLACPVQDRMHHCMSSSLFEKIYSLYSYRDIIQILAPNFLKKEGLALKNIKANPFSKRMFPAQSNLVQSRVIFNGNGPRHNDFVRQPFLSILPTIVAHMETWDPLTDQKKHLTHIVKDG